MADIMADMFLAMRRQSPVAHAWTRIEELKNLIQSAYPVHKPAVEKRFEQLRNYYYANSRQTLLRIRDQLPSYAPDLVAGTASETDIISAKDHVMPWVAKNFPEVTPHSLESLHDDYKKRLRVAAYLAMQALLEL